MGELVCGFGGSYLFGEFSKEVIRIVRARTGLRMVLNAKGAVFLVSETRDSAVVEIGVGDFHVSREGGWIDRIPVILRRDGDFS